MYVGLCGGTSVSLICWALWGYVRQSDMLGFVGGGGYIRQSDMLNFVGVLLSV